MNSSFYIYVSHDVICFSLCIALYYSAHGLVLLFYCYFAFHSFGYLLFALLAKRLSTGVEG